MPTEQELIDAGVALQSTVLKVGHHGSKTSSSQSFMDKVNPTLVFYINSYGGYSSELLGLLNQGEAKERIVC